MPHNNTQISNEDYLDEDEIDLVKLVSASADIASQYVVFEGSNGEYYAINVAKVTELFVFQKDNIAVNNDKNNIIIGTADIRSHMTPLIYFDEWFGNKNFETTAYELLILCHFSSEYLGLIVKQVIDIISIEPAHMYNNAKHNEQTTFIAKVAIGKKLLLCTVFDTDKLLYDLYGNDKAVTDKQVQPIQSNKMVLFADDSKLIRKMAYDTFDKLGVRFKIYDDGQELLDALKTINIDDIGIFLLDIEMPKKTGIDVINELRNQASYSNIPIVVHTNMANSSITGALNSKKVSKIIGKVDFESIESAIREYIL
ncbi:chemotaxis protein CheV [bacterium]|nr:chemotaxis protein CheV [bacterium]MBU1994186.1 chemotaxis protein CheV [bacterium]